MNLLSRQKHRGIWIIYLRKMMLFLWPNTHILFPIINSISLPSFVTYNKTDYLIVFFCLCSYICTSETGKVWEFSSILSMLFCYPYSDKAIYSFNNFTLFSVSYISQKHSGNQVRPFWLYNDSLQKQLQWEKVHIFTRKVKMRSAKKVVSEAAETLEEGRSAPKSSYF